ncbi:thioredoxinprotein [Fusobacterium periodonticum]|uniref:Thioredoxinprotein n=1 Tax=Fusobacterium periodonticum TaxID=860 RepID=A0AAD0HST8_9FUSO|nr:thioredoxinprotein [Fusobacterium periodonticum]
MRKVHLILLIILGIFLFNACMTNDYYYISPTGEKSKIVKSNPPLNFSRLTPYEC